MSPSRRSRMADGEGGPDPIDVHVGKRLRLARLGAGLSQDELGQGMGVSFQAVQKYEQGENRLSASRLFRASSLVEQTTSFFFEGLDRPTSMSNVAVLTPDELELVRDYRQIASKEVREQLLHLARRMGNVRT
jgi:transcriptional regulator with XRE-family HTH domain